MCKEIVQRLRRTEIDVHTTTGADTAATRKVFRVPKTPANDAACCLAHNTVTRCREPAKLNAVGHGRRKQIKGLPAAKYTAWRRLPPAARKRTPCPNHAAHPNVVNGIRTGDVIRLRTTKGWLTGRAEVEAARRQVRTRKGRKTYATTKPARMQRVAPRNGYTKSN